MYICMLYTVILAVLSLNRSEGVSPHVLNLLNEQMQVVVGDTFKKACQRTLPYACEDPAYKASRYIYSMYVGNSRLRDGSLGRLLWPATRAKHRWEHG